MSAAAVAKDEEHAWEEMSELARFVQHNAAARLQLLEVEDMLVAWMDLPPESPVLHLPPASPYFRMLVHRLVEAFGVTHVSFGEGEDRHIVLQRNEDSKIPPVLLLDVLSTADGPTLPSAAPQILRRSAADPADGTPPPKTPPDPLPTLSERQQAYEEARARIFARNYSDGNGGLFENYERTTERERRVPVVAQRLIGRALGVATGGTRVGEQLQTGQNRSGSGGNGQQGVAKSREDLITGGVTVGEKREGDDRSGGKMGQSNRTKKGSLAAASRCGEKEGQNGTSVAKAAPEQASIKEEVERFGGRENDVHLSDAGQGQEKGDPDCEQKGPTDCGEGLQQRGLGGSLEEAISESFGGSESDSKSDRKATWEPKLHKRRGRKRPTKARDGSQPGNPSIPDELGRGAVLGEEVEETKKGETGESPVRNAVQKVYEDGAFGNTPSDTGGEKTTGLRVDRGPRKAARSPGQGAAARMFRMALPRGQIGQRTRTERVVRGLPKDETSAGERPCRESNGASTLSDVEIGPDVSNVCSSNREESSMSNAPAETQELDLRDTHASRLETNIAAENLESTVKRKGLPLVAGKMLSHALGLTQRGWGQVGRR